jgi:Tfp pilus assembly protein PilN
VRPVNLIPPEEQRGTRAPARTGPLAYVVVGVLAVALLGVVGVVLTDNQIADRQTQVTELQGQLDRATAQAHRLQSYADFAAMETARNETVSTLAKSRFDWYRVLRELALVIPNNVWLTQLQGSVTPGATQGLSGGGTSGGGASSADVASQVTGPSLSMSGCAASHDAVAQFLGALHDIDGVTRVVVTQSQRADGSASGASTAAAGAAGGASGCSVRNFIAQFQVLVAFDKVPIDPTTGLVTPSTTTPTATAPTSTGTPVSGGGSGVRAQEAEQRQSAAQQSAKAHQAVSTLIPGTVRP